MARQKNMPILTLSVAASLLHLHPRTLMVYEKEGLIKPHRTTTGRRLFSEADLSTIQFIHFLTYQKKINLNGVKIISDLFEKLFSKHPNLKKDFFSDFEEKELL